MSWLFSPFLERLSSLRKRTGRLRLATLKRAATWVITAWICALPLTPPVMAQAADDPDPAPLIEALMQLEQWNQVPRCAGILVRYGSAYAPALLEFLAEGESSRVGAQVELTAYRRAAVQTALWRLPVDDSRAFLSQLAGRTKSPAQRIEAMRLLGRFGRVSDFELLIRLATAGAPSESLVGPGLRQAFERTLGAMLRDDLPGLRFLTDGVGDLPPSLQAPMIRCVGDLNAEAAIPLLSAMLGQSNALDALILIEVGNCRVSSGRALQGADFDRVRGYLLAPDTNLAALAASVVVSLGDHGAMEGLLDLMWRTDEGLDEVATRALQHLTGRKLGPDPMAWSEWYDSESEWWEASSEPAWRILQSGSVPETCEVISQIAGLRLYPEELVELLRLGLQRPEALVLRTACRALENFDSSSAAIDLASLLDDSRSDVREAAHKALMEITGLDLPPRAHAWIEGLASTDRRR